MKRIEGPNKVKLIECVNVVRGKWRIRWDVQEREDGATTYMETEFMYKPSIEEIRQTIIGWYNRQTDEAILHGFKYEDAMVWLSRENQFNYKAAYDIAVQTNGANLPVTFKFGTDDKPVYKVFCSIEELTVFYNELMMYIQRVLEEGWEKKDKLNLSHYEI